MMMNVMRDHVEFFDGNFDREVPADETEERVFEFEGAVSAEPVHPEVRVRAHHEKSVDEDECGERPRKISREEQDERREQSAERDHRHDRKPIATLQRIEVSSELAKYFTFGWNIKFAVTDVAICWRFQ